MGESVVCVKAALLMEVARRFNQSLLLLRRISLETTLLCTGSPQVCSSNGGAHCPRPRLFCCLRCSQCIICYRFYIR